ncbi:hypothetical protein BC628DRAFT_1407641 [Trametes gibbosa]|nr:hypothetical protein BC628DRAFT_1407641 [Trametes gibbosa]
MSTFRQGQVYPSSKCLLGIAEELQVIILLALDAANILSCTKVCHGLAELVKCTPALQYKLELGLAGMVDGPAKGVSFATRLEQLRAYQSAWGANDIPLQETNVSAHRGRYCGRLLRPASVFSGIQEEVKLVHYFKEMSDEVFKVRTSAVDFGQDLVAITKSVLGEIPQLYFLSISQDGAYHPLAAAPTFEAEEKLGFLVDSEEELEICEDLAAWNVSADVAVLNWQTGKVVFSYGTWHEGDEESYMRCHLLGPTHFVIVDNEGLHVRVVDRTKSSRNSSRSCVFKLPQLAGNSRIHGMNSNINFPPTYPGCGALFQRDPSLTLLAIEFSVCDSPRWNHCDYCKSFVLFVPVATLLERVRDIANPSKEAAPDGMTRTVLPWDKWGPLGARIVEVDTVGGFDISTNGSQCLITPDRDSETAAGDVYLLDIYPLVAHAPQGPRDVGGSVVDTSDCITRPECFAYPLHSSLSYRIARKHFDPCQHSEPPNGSGRRSYLSSPSISHDALLSSRCSFTTGYTQRHCFRTSRVILQ